MSLQINPVVFITGASSGIGAAVAREFAKQGADLVLVARRLDRLEAVAQEIQGMGRRVHVMSCDVTREGEIERGVQTAVEKMGRIDIVFANAGFGVAAPFEELTLEDYRRQFETNVFGLLRTVFATLPVLKKSQGTLVLLGSIAGEISLPGASPYSMSKFAVHALAEALTGEFKAFGVSVCLIAPGFVESEIRLVDNQGIYHDRAQDPIPSWLVVPADVAAREIIRAIRKHRKKTFITFHGKVAAWAKRWVPWVISALAVIGLKARQEPKNVSAS